MNYDLLLDVRLFASQSRRSMSKAVSHLCSYALAVMEDQKNELERDRKKQVELDQFHEQIVQICEEDLDLVKPLQADERCIL